MVGGDGPDGWGGDDGDHGDGGDGCYGRSQQPCGWPLPCDEPLSLCL